MRWLRSTPSQAIQNSRCRWWGVVRSPLTNQYEKLDMEGALFAVLSFPILLPLLMVLVGATEKILTGETFGVISTELQFLFAFAVVMITGSVLLFKFVWLD